MRCKACDILMKATSTRLVQGKRITEELCTVCRSETYRDDYDPGFILQDTVEGLTPPSEAPY